MARKPVIKVLAFSCNHEPFSRDDYLKFIVDTYNSEGCNKIVCLGDFFDNHSISFHEHDPDGMSAGEEFKNAAARAKTWAAIFPKMDLVYGNHDLRPYRQSFTHGMPKVLTRTPNEIWDLPKGWVWHDRLEVDGVIYIHGDGKSGKYVYANWCDDNMQSTVSGHAHSCAGVYWHASPRSLIFGLGVGCGMDTKSYAAAYGKRLPKKPIIGCGVVKGGVDAAFIPMKL